MKSEVGLYQLYLHYSLKFYFQQTTLIINSMIEYFQLRKRTLIGFKLFSHLAINIRGKLIFASNDSKHTLSPRLIYRQTQQAF